VLVALYVTMIRILVRFLKNSRLVEDKRRLTSTARSDCAVSLDDCYRNDDLNTNAGGRCRFRRDIRWESIYPVSLGGDWEWWLLRRALACDWE
jgi:hypothetical protein